jgi:probable HAF family extracellular repeat protein
MQQTAGDTQVSASIGIREKKGEKGLAKGSRIPCGQNAPRMRFWSYSEVECLMAKANRLALLVLVGLSLAAFAAAQSYTVTDLGPGGGNAINSLGDVAIGSGSNSFVWSPGGSLLALAPLPGDSLTVPLGINRQGLAVGASGIRNGASSAVLWTNGEPLDLGRLGGTSSAATAINASGEVTGSSAIPSSTAAEAFLWTKATGMQGLGFLPGDDFSAASAINRFGQVVGTSAGANGSYAFIWSKTTGMKDLGKLPGGTFSSASAINDLGQAAGYSNCGTGCDHAVLWNKAKGSMLDLGLLAGGVESYAEGINNAGQVVGVVYYGPNRFHPFIWSPSTGMLDLNSLIPANSGWLLQFAQAINDKGQIVGQGTLNGQAEAFLLTPQ